MGKEINVSNYGGGVSFTGLLTIAFIVLKLTGVINWSWFWVLFPVIIPIGVVTLFLIGYIFLTIYLIAVSSKNKTKLKK